MECQRQWPPPQVVGQYYCDSSHWDPEDQKPADSRDQQHQRCNEAIEDEEEDDPAQCPLTTAKKTPLRRGQACFISLASASPAE